MNNLYSNCHLCPRECGVDRYNHIGFCREKAIPRIAWCGLHKGEEGPISGDNGSGMFFFTGCTLGCKYCQNYQISLENDKFDSSVELDEDTAVRLCWELKNMGANTISFVTAEHFAPFVVNLIKKLKKDGFALPFVLNTSGFIGVSTISMLIGLIDIWLWDTKTHSKRVASEFCGCEGYVEVEKKGLDYLCKNDKNSLIIVRHLVLPGSEKESAECIKDFEKYKGRCAFSLMGQFISPKDPSLIVKENEYNFVKKVLFSTDIEDGFIQELGDEGSWIPDFYKKNPFPHNFATTSPLFESLRSKFDTCRGNG